MYLAERIDDYGKAAWIGLMVLGFIVWWPIGLAILGFLLWSGRMGCGYRGNWGAWKREQWQRLREQHGESGGFGRSRRGLGSGNTAFDEYRSETLRRLEDEQREFMQFLHNLRHAKDKAEFDQFMAERRNAPPKPPAPETPQPGA